MKTAVLCVLALCLVGRCAGISIDASSYDTGTCDGNATLAYNDIVNGECFQLSTALGMFGVEATCAGSGAGASWSAAAFATTTCSGSALINLSGTSDVCLDVLSSGTGLIVTCLGSGGGPSGNGTCFSGTATVQRDDGAVVPVSDVNIGDRLLSVSPSGDAMFDKVFRITHHDPKDTFTTMLRLTTASGKTLELSSSHFLHVNTCCSPSSVVPASKVVVGDRLFLVTYGTEAPVPDTVTSIETVKATGVYNFHTLSSNVVVNGIAASHFSEQTTWSSFGRRLAPLWYSVLDALPFAPENAKL